MSKTVITEKTQVSVKILITVVVVVVWLIRLEGRVDAEAKQSDTAQVERAQNDQVVRSIDMRLSRMEGKLDAFLKDSDDR